MPIVSRVGGDIVKLGKAGQYKAVVHGANCKNTMGAGLAPQIAKAWPGAWEADQRTIRGDRGKLGMYTCYHDETVDVRVFNLYTQFGFDRTKVGDHNVDYEAIARVFKSLNSLLPSIDNNKQVLDVRKVGIPTLGAGLAGGHWQAISTIIDLVTPNIDIELVTYIP
jgi:O-acetyl-ADP-ribose deacetylase (regulator of RNase III)